MSARERGFFSEVGAYIRNLQRAVLPAETGAGLLTLLKTIHPAFPWTEKALPEQFAPAFFHKQMMMHS
jgi:hypothetical protein